MRKRVEVSLFLQNPTSAAMVTGATGGAASAASAAAAAAEGGGAGGGKRTSYLVVWDNGCGMDTERCVLFLVFLCFVRVLGGLCVGVLGVCVRRGWDVRKGRGGALARARRHACKPHLPSTNLTTNSPPPPPRPLTLHTHPLPSHPSPTNQSPPIHTHTLNTGSAPSPPTSWGRRTEGWHHVTTRWLAVVGSVP
jgi:hypothetical protein